VRRDIAGSIATGHGLDDQGVGVPVVWGQEFLLLYVVQVASGAHPVSYSMGRGGLFPGVKRPHLELVLRSREHAWVYTFTSPYVFMA
jgi:hypothetical protein